MRLSAYLCLICTCLSAYLLKLFICLSVLSAYLFLSAYHLPGTMKRIPPCCLIAQGRKNTTVKHASHLLDEANVLDA